MMKFKYCALLVLFLPLFENCSHKIKITPVITRLDSMKMGDKFNVARFDIYLMEGYQNDTESNKFVDNFVKNNSVNRSAYFEYQMWFIKSSDVSNLNSLKESMKPNGTPLDNERDFIFYYDWQDYGKAFTKEKTDTGKATPHNIKIENIPDTTSQH